MLLPTEQLSWLGSNHIYNTKQPKHLNQSMYIHWHNMLVGVAYSTCDLHGPELMSLALLYLGDRHCHLLILYDPLVGPVLETLMPSHLHTLGCHDNHMYMLFPHHPPKVDERLLNRS